MIALNGCQTGYKTARLQDGVVIAGDDARKRLQYNEGRCSLYIDQVRTEDEAEYVCQARNVSGTDATWGEHI